MKYAKSYVVMALKILMKDVMIQIQMIWTDVQLFAKLKLDGPALDFLQFVFLYVVMGQYSQSLVMMLILLKYQRPGQNHHKISYYFLSDINLLFCQDSNLYILLQRIFPFEQYFSTRKAAYEAFVCFQCKNCCGRG